MTMTRTGLNLSVLVALAVSTAAAAMDTTNTTTGTQTGALRLMTWNLRFDSMPDNISVAQTLAALPQNVPTDDQVNFYGDAGEEPWSTRRVGVAREVLFTAPVIFGVQEALARQVHDLADPALLGTDYDWIGVGRDDGVEAGEFEAIFYRKDTVTLHDWTTFWLSNTPFEPSKFPSAGSIRTATLAHFSTATTGPFTLICTHWDDQSDGQRRLAASLIRYRGAFEAFTTQRPVLVLGDFNSGSSGSDSGAYSIMTGTTPPENINATFAQKYASPDSAEFVFRDFADETPPFGRSGELATFTGFAAAGDTGAFQRIDFTMGGSNGGWVAKRYRAGTNWWDQGYHISDHRPVWVDLGIEK